MTPQLLVRPETEDRELVLRVHATYARVKRLLSEARPDVICVVASDHVEGFFLDAVPAFVVYTGDPRAGYRAGARPHGKPGAPAGGLRVLLRRP